jgi:hypothetical protein
MHNGENSTEISPAAVVYAFAAWLTTRRDPVTFGATHDAAPAAELVAAFCESQGFAELKDPWHFAIKPYPNV